MALPVLKIGSRGTFVALAQIRLKAHDHSLTVDGSFGTGTETATKAFQSSKGLTADGVVGADTWTSLLASPAKAPAPAPAPAPTPTPTPAPVVRATIRRGDTGALVTEAQRRLLAHGRSLTVDGSFGPAMEAATKNFQQVKGLSVDGVIGPATWAALLATPTSTPAPAPAPVVDRKPDVKRILSLLGWRVDTEARYVQAVKDFQRAWNLGPALTVDGDAGPKTHDALKISEARKKAGRGDISEHFSTHELDCKCLGKYASCRRIWATRSLLQALEKYRTLSGSFTPISVCRCPSHNAAVGGSTASAHMSGLAADVPAVYSVSQVRALKAFTNIGYNSKGGTVRHVDIRTNTTGTVTSPRTYPY